MTNTGSNINWTVVFLLISFVFLGTINVLASVTSTSCSESKDSAVVTEYSEHYKSICDNVTDVVTDTSDDLFFLYGRSIFGQKNLGIAGIVWV